MVVGGIDVEDMGSTSVVIFVEMAVGDNVVVVIGVGVLLRDAVVDKVRYVVVDVNL